MIQGRGGIHSRYAFSFNCKDQTNLQAPIRRINKIEQHGLSATKSLLREYGSRRLQTQTNPGSNDDGLVLGKSMF